MVEAPIRFASLVGGVLVYETIFFRDCPSHKDLYNIQVLRYMDDVPGYYFSNLVEIVVDSSRRHLKDYLVDFPRTK
jgi:hypothetical protein